MKLKLSVWLLWVAGAVFFIAGWWVFFKQPDAPWMIKLPAIALGALALGVATGETFKAWRGQPPRA